MYSIKECIIYAKKTLVKNFLLGTFLNAYLKHRIFEKILLQKLRESFLKKISFKPSTDIYKKMIL